MSVSNPAKNDKFPLSYFDHEFPLPVIATETKLDQSIQPRRLQPIVKRTITEVSDEIQHAENQLDKIGNERDDLKKNPDAVILFHSKKKRTKEEKRARKQAKKAKLEAAKATEAEYIETFEDND